MKQQTLMVTVFGNKKQVFSREDLADMIILFDMYKGADNLPKWIYEAGLSGVPNFPTTWDEVKALLITWWEDATPISINVASDDRKHNSIEWYS